MGLRYGLAADCRRCSIELSLLCGAAIRSAIRFVERKVRAARKSYFACGCFIDLFDCSDRAPLAVTSHRPAEQRIRILVTQRAEHIASICNTSRLAPVHPSKRSRGLIVCDPQHFLCGGRT